MQAIGPIKSGDATKEQQLCQQIMMAMRNPSLVTALSKSNSFTEQGIPMAAATLAMSLGTPGVDIPSRILQIEEIIRQGG